MPLPIDDPAPERERPAPAEPRLCPVCNRLGTGRVCAGCGLDVVTGELVQLPEAPPWRPDPGLARRRRRDTPPRTVADLLQAVGAESLRGWLGTLVATLWAAPLCALGLRPLVAFLCAFLLADRSRAALGSSLVLLAPAEAEPADAEPAPDARLRPREWLTPLLQAGGLTLLVSPLVSATLTPNRISALQSAGFLALASGATAARVFALGTVFLTAAAGCLALRVTPGRHRLSAGQGSRPFDVLELLGSLPKACLLVFPLLALAAQPATVALLVPCLPLIVGALASGWGDLAPRPLLHALRTTPRYGLTVALSAGPLIVLAALLALGPHIGVELAAPGLVLSASLLGVLAGVARQDCESNQDAGQDHELPAGDQREGQAP